jgi:hypothetical protein
LAFGVKAVDVEQNPEQKAECIQRTILSFGELFERIF